MRPLNPAPLVGSGDAIPISKALPADLSRNLSLVFGVSNFSDSLRPVATSGDIIRNSGRIGLCPTRVRRRTTSSAVSLLRRVVNNRTLALARRWGHPQFAIDTGQTPARSVRLIIMTLARMSSSGRAQAQS